MGNSNSLNPLEAKKMIGNQYGNQYEKNMFEVILDVRTDIEWNEGHYPNAIHIQIDSVEKKFTKTYPNKDTKVLIYCKSGMRAGKAYQILNSLGYTNVYFLNGSGYTSLM